MKNKERKKKKGRARIKNKKQQPLVSWGSPGALPGALPVCRLPPLTPGKPSRQGGTDSASSLTTLLAAAAAAKLLQLYPTLCDPIDGSPPGSCPWDSPGKNTGVGCHFLLRCMKVKVKLLSRVRLLATPWTAAHQAPPSVGFSRQEYWSGVPLPSELTKYLLNG